jgi:hypothetical protein
VEITPNEWLLEYMVPGFGKETLVMDFLDAFEASNDILLVRIESPFTQKLYDFSKRYQFNPRNLFKRFHMLMRNPKIRIVYENELVPLPQELVQACPTEDLYLIELAAVSIDKHIVTTDQRFQAAINGIHGYTLSLATEFLEEYFRRHRAVREL